MSNAKIAVLGSGANGSSIAADLIVAGLDVVLIEQWPEHVRAMRSGGLRVTMPDETRDVTVRVCDVCDVCTLRQEFDVVLNVMKAYDTAWSTQLIEPYLARDGIVAGVQNGMTTDTIADIVGAHRTLGCVIEISSVLVEPGVVRRHSPPSRSWFAVGGLSSETAGREREVAELLSHSGGVEVVDDIRATKWMKLVSNCSTLVPMAILGGPMLQTLAMPGMRELMLRAGQEALETGAALGYEPLPIFGLEPRHVRDPDRIVELLLKRICAGFITPTTTTTVLYDWRHKRRSEVDQVNGLVVAEQARFGGRAPVNEALVEIARRIERGELEPAPSNQEVLDAILSSADAAPR